MKQPSETENRGLRTNRLFLRSMSIDWEGLDASGSYVSRIPALRSTNSLVFRSSVTFFAGENGTGKSTLLEAIAAASGLNPEGGTRNYHFSTYDDVSGLAGAVRLTYGPVKPKSSYFLRAESFFNVATATNELYNDGSLPDYHARSHGESFLDFIQRYSAPGLYLMDEPEAALSPQRQLALLLHLVRSAQRGSQFLIVTHSPILLAVPGADILSLDGDSVHSVDYEDTESVRITRLFLGDRERFLSRLLESDD